MFATILDTTIPPTTPTYTDWFPMNTLFIIFQSDSTGEYTETGEFVEVAVALFSRMQESPLIERLCALFQESINTIDLIPIPGQLYRNDLFPMRLLINPSTGFHCRIIAITGQGTISNLTDEQQIDGTIQQIQDLTNQINDLLP
jgi:hypothetical protein